MQNPNLNHSQILSLTLSLLILLANTGCDTSAEALLGKKPINEPEAKVRKTYCGESHPTFNIKSSKAQKKCDTIGFNSIASIGSQLDGSIVIELNDTTAPSDDINSSDNVAISPPLSPEIPELPHPRSPRFRRPFSVTVLDSEAEVTHLAAVPPSTSPATTPAPTPSSSPSSTQGDGTSEPALNVVRLTMERLGPIDDSYDPEPSKGLKTVPLNCVKRENTSQFVCTAAAPTQFINFERSEFIRYQMKEFEVTSSCGAVTVFSYNRWGYRECGPKTEGEAIAEFAPDLFLDKKSAY
jgi:hypothetical protein